MAIPFHSDKDTKINNKMLYIVYIFSLVPADELGVQST